MSMDPNDPAAARDDPYRPDEEPFVPPVLRSEGSVYDQVTAAAAEPDETEPDETEVAGPEPEQPTAPQAEPAASRPRRRWRGALALTTIAAVIGGAVGAGTAVLLDRDSDRDSGLNITDSVAAPTPPPDGSIGAAAGKIGPSVVTLDVAGPQGSDTGSGVIIRSDGYILTNDHVVSGAAASGSISVILSDGRTGSAHIVGRDAGDDLAVLKADQLGTLTAATFGRSDLVTVGQAVVAVGAPLGLSDTVTSGIVSNVARPVRAGDDDQAVFEAIQTDAAINPGNSGGPLIDLNGSVVGITAAIATSSSPGVQVPGLAAGSIGIGFAISSNEASRIAGELILTGKASHAVLGVTLRGGATPPVGATPSQSVIIHSVTAAGPAAKARLMPGDAISAIGTHRVSTADALIAAIRSTPPGARVQVTYARAGRGAKVTVHLGSASG